MPDGGGRSDADADAVNADPVIQGESGEAESGGAIFNLVSDPWAGVTTAKANMEPKYCIVINNIHDKNFVD